MGRKKKVIDISGVPDFDLVNPGIGIGGDTTPVFNNIIPDDFETKAKNRRAQEKHQKENTPSFFNPLTDEKPASAIIENSWILPALYRASERNAESRDFKEEPDFKVDDDRLDRLPTQYTNKNRDYLKESTSQHDFAARQRWVEEDETRERTAAAYGFVPNMLGAFLDPEMLALVVATGGESFLGAATRTGKILKNATVGAAQGGLIEGAMVAGNTQRGPDDILRGIATGGALMGAFGTLGKLRATPKAALESHLSENIELAMQRDAKWLLEADAVTLDKPTFLRKGIAGKDANFPAEAPVFEGEAATHPRFESYADDFSRLDDQHITLSIDGHRKNLVTKGNLDMTGRTGAALKKELLAKAETIRADLAEMLEVLTGHRATVAAAHGAVRNADDATTLAFRMQGIENIYRPAMERAQVKLEGITERLDNAKAARGSREQLAAFDAKSRVEQIHELYPKGAPKTREIVQRHRFALDTVSAVSEVAEHTRATALLDKLDPLAEAGEMFDLLTDTPLKKSLTRETTGEIPVPGHAERTPKQVAERAEKVEALKERSTSGQTTKEFLNSLVDKAVQRGRQSINYLPYKWMRDRLQGAFTNLDQSENEAFRGINFMMHEAPQGGFTPEQTVAAFEDIYKRQIQTQEMHRWEEGFTLWSQEQGRNKVSALMNVGGHKTVFDEEVFLKVFNPTRESSAGVTMAADAHRDGLYKAVSLRIQNGEMGFEGLIPDRNYMPIIFDSNKIVHHLSLVGDAKVQQLVSKAYQQGKFRLTAKSADRLAEMQIRRAKSHQLSGNQVFKNVVSESEVKGFVADLKKHGVPDDYIAGLLEERETDALMDNISNRAKFSLGLNPEVEHDGLRMLDVLNTDTTLLTQNYYRESAGGAALAKKGFKSFEHYNRIVNEAEEMGRELGYNPVRNREEAEMLRDAGKQVYGRPLVENPDDLLKTSLRRGMSWIALRALGMLGFAQVPEAGRAMAMLGAHDVLENIPSVAFFRRKAARVGEEYSGQLHDPVNRDIEFALGYQGEDKLLAPMHIRGESFQQIADPSGEIGKILDNGLALGANINNIVSGFQATQGGMEKVVGRTIYQKLIKMAEGDIPFGSSQMTDEVGWTKEWFAEFRDFHNAHPRSEMFNGETVRLIDHEAMPVALKDSMLIGMNRLRGRAIQANFIGDFNPWIEKTLGKPLTQFRRFSVVSTEKQLIHDLRGDKIQAAQTLAWSSMLSLMSYTTRAHMKALGEDDPQAYLDKALTPEAIGYGVINFLPQVAGPAMLLEMAGAGGLVPTRFQAAPERTGVQSKYSPPVLSGITDPIKAVHSAVQALDGSGTVHDVAKKTFRLLPFQSAMGFNYLRNKTTNIFE